MNTGNFPRRKDRRQKEAIERTEQRSKRSNKGQIAKLDAGHFRAEKERKRLES